MGYGDIRAFGNDAVETPNLDRLAAEGVCLTQHYSGSPVCAPARAALMTGRYPHRTGAIDTFEGRGLDRLALREITLGAHFKRAGYTTGLMGKWHLGALDPRYHPNRRGFDEFAGFRGGWSDYWQWRLDRNGSFAGTDGRYLTDVLTEEAAGFIRRHRSEPFLLHVAYNAPHFPFQAPAEEIEPFREKGTYTEAVSTIYGMNRRMDKGIGAILDELQRQGLDQNTIVIFASDNGPQHNGEGEQCTTRYNACFNGQKCLTYEGGIRVPAIIRWPAGLDAGRRSSALVHFTDWLPTLASACGVELATDRTLDGTDLLGVLRGDEPSPDRALFWQWNRYAPVGCCNAAMRNGPWKLLRPAIPQAMHVAEEDLVTDHRLKYEPEKQSNIDRNPEPERTIPDPPAPLLFNLEHDPYETEDLSHRHADIVSLMQCELDNWFDAVESDRRTICDD